MPFLYDTALNQPKNKLDMEMIARRVNRRVNNYTRRVNWFFLLGGGSIAVSGGIVCWVIYEVAKKIF
jgi:hypothetical protein